MDENEQEPIWYCPACGDPIDYCQGHGRIGDPIGYAIVTDHHENDRHDKCAPVACPVARDRLTESEARVMDGNR